MSKNPSLNHQFFYVLEECTELGRSKHSDKGTENNLNHTIIYSRADRQGLADTAKDFVGYIKENYNEVRNVRDIKPEMVQNFIDTKVVNTKNSIEKTWSHLGKIERMADQVFSIKLDWKEKMQKPESDIIGKIRTISFDPNDWKLIKGLIDSKGEKLAISDKGLILGRSFGLRAESITNISAKDVTITEGAASLFIHHDKGNRDRTLTTKDPNIIANLESLVKNKRGDDILIPIKPGSINKELARLETDLGIRGKYQEAKTGVHAIRKMWAKEQFINHMENNLTKQEGMDKVSQSLGHGKNRNELMIIYIGQETLSQY
jgi:hypothetical protein